jgi:serralysin
MIFENPLEGVDRVKIAADYALTDNVENLALLGTGDFIASGNASVNIITGNRGANQILGLEGNDILKGGRGDDMLTGGSDADTFIFNHHSDVDTITDFNQAEHDRIQLKGWTNIESFKDLSGHISNEGGNAVIDFGDADVLVISGVDAGALKEGDFLF